MPNAELAKPSGYGEAFQVQRRWSLGLSSHSTRCPLPPPYLRVHLSLVKPQTSTHRHKQDNFPDSYNPMWTP